MRLPFKSPPDAAAGPDAVQAARTQARRRLVGALVLLVAGVIGFPLLFETTPRPVALDTPIVVSPRGGTPPPPPRPAAREAVVEPAQPAASAAPPAATGDRVATEATRPEAAPPKPVPDKPAAAAPRAAPASAPVAAARSTPAPVAAPPAPADDAARARALLEGKTAPASPTPASAPAPGGRFVVQVGAFTDATTLREARDRVEKLGLKTYTQVVEVDGSKRTRLRVGPFPSREEALAAAGKLKGAGLPANVLTL